MPGQSGRDLSLAPALWQLPSLAWLKLDDLDSLTSIFVGSDDTNNVESSISSPSFFPKLVTMRITKMPKLERWYQEVAGQVEDVSFPQLKTLYISECPMLSSMPKMLPLLEDLQVKKASEIPIGHLMNLSVQPNLECKYEISVEPGVGWLPIDDLHLLRLGESSVRLGLKGLKDNVERFEEELNRVPCRFIKNLDIIDCNCLFSYEPSQIQRNIWNHFRFVESMWIMGRNNIVQWPAVEFRSLICLRRLHLSDCYNLTGSLSSAIFDDENAMPPRLQHLKFHYVKTWWRYQNCLHLLKNCRSVFVAS